MTFDDDEYTLDDKAAFYEPIRTEDLERCQNCGRPCEELVYLEAWDFQACPTCARECQLTDEAERLCPELYSELIRANGIREVEAAFKAHPDSGCQDCRAKPKPALAEETQTGATQDSGERREVA